jgi:hypothetical protein
MPLYMTLPKRLTRIHDGLDETDDGLDETDNSLDETGNVANNVRIVSLHLPCILMTMVNHT